MATKKKTDDPSYNKLKTYIQGLFPYDDIPWAMIMAQLNKLMKDNKQYTYSSIYYILWYIKNITDVDILIQTPFALVPYYYNEAMRYYNKQKQINNAIKQFKQEDNIVVIKQHIKDDTEDIFD